MEQQSEKHCKIERDRMKEVSYFMRKKKNPREEAICGTETRRDLLDSSWGPVFIYWVKPCIFIAILAFTGSFAIHPPLKMMR